MLASAKGPDTLRLGYVRAGVPGLLRSLLSRPLALLMMKEPLRTTPPLIAIRNRSAFPLVQPTMIETPCYRLVPIFATRPSNRVGTLALVKMLLKPKLSAPLTLSDPKQVVCALAPRNLRSARFSDTAVPSALVSTLVSLDEQLIAIPTPRNA